MTNGADKKKNNPLSDIVSSQYEKWTYPKPILDLDQWLENNWQWFDPIHAHRIFWPDQDYRHGLDILIAGCGTNQAAVFAYNNPQANVVGIDVSQSSLEHQRYLIEKYKMKNLELYLLPIEDVEQLNRQFDLIVSTGVLHHLADPQKGLQALAVCLREQGVVALMLYAKYGRMGVEILQSVGRDLGLEQDEESLAVVKNMLSILPQNHPIQSYISIAPDLQYDAGLVDTFLHGRDTSYTVKDCINLVAGAGLVFQDMYIKSPYYSPANPSNAFHSYVLKQSEEMQWSIMERINFENGCHFFTACRRDRPQESYKIDFADSNFLDYRPELRFRCTLNGDTLSRYNWSTQLGPIETAFIQRIDGDRTIRKIIADASQTNLLVNMKMTELEKLAKNLFQRLWRLDFLVMGLGRPS
jgi:SAM-dependent methyltransferase